MNENTKEILRRLVKEEQGIQHVEEALLVALIGVAAVVAINGLMGGVTEVFGDTESTLRASTT